MFTVSLLFHLDGYRGWTRNRRRYAMLPSCRWQIMASLHIIGFLGIALYVHDFSAALGGAARFWTLLATTTYVVRWQAVDTLSVGTQLSYAGWIATALTVILVRVKRLPKKWLVVAAVQYLGNALFLGRTRLFWILIVTIVMLAPLIKRSLSLRRTSLIALATLVTLVVVFISIGAWIGKLQAANVSERDSDVPYMVQNLYLYATAGFAYFNAVVETESPHPGFEGIAYPLYQVGRYLHVSEKPRSQINATLYLPFGVNVGTFLEPFFRDGGYPLTIVGILIATICVDYAALYFWTSNNYFGWYASAQLCFSSALAGFSPKITTFPVWLFLGSALVAMALQRRARRHVDSRARPNDCPTIPNERTDYVR
jgi:hypothetical protein